MSPFVLSCPLTESVNVSVLSPFSKNESDVSFKIYGVVFKIDNRHKTKWNGEEVGRRIKKSTESESGQNNKKRLYTKIPDIEPNTRRLDRNNQYTKCN